MGWVALVTAIIGLAKELLEHQRESDESDLKCAANIVEATHAVKESRKSKNTAKIELAFATGNARSS